MRTAARKYRRQVVAMLALMLVAVLVGTYILSHQRLSLPGWLPLVGPTRFTLNAEFPTAQAVTPGQGQTVDVSGVQVGHVTHVGLRDGRAVVSMRIDQRFAQIYSDATVLLRPKTGLKDMVVELDPGSPSRGRRLESGATLPISQGLPDVNLDEILAGLDGDTRNYLSLLIGGAGQGLADNGPALADTFRRFTPTARDLQRAARMVGQRRARLARLIHNFRLLTGELASRQRQLTEFVSSSSAVFGHVARQNASLDRSLALLPGALRTTDQALLKADRLARTLGSTLSELRPGARALGPSLRQVQPFLRRSTPIFRRQLRPFARDAQPTVRVLVPAARDLAAATPGLTGLVRVVNAIVNELSYQPRRQGRGREGYLFYLAWANHDTNSLFTGQDAYGPVRRGIVLMSCDKLSVLNSLLRAGNPTLSLLIGLLNSPSSAQVCPAQPAAPAASPRSPGSETIAAGPWRRRPPRVDGGGEG